MRDYPTLHLNAKSSKGTVLLSHRNLYDRSEKM